MADRKEFLSKTRKAALARSGKVCEAVGTWYGLPDGERCTRDLAYGVQYDHLILDANSKDNSLENCRAVCPKCHDWKTRNRDTPTAAKTVAQSLMGMKTRPKAKIASPPQGTPSRHQAGTGTEGDVYHEGANQMTTKAFPTFAVLSVVTGRLLGDVGGVYEVLNFMSGESLFTHQLPRVGREAEPVILALHSELAEAVAEAEQVNETNWSEWLATWTSRYGETITVPTLNIAEHERIDPISELAEKVHPDKINVVSP